MENRTEKDYPAWAYRGILIAATIIWGGNFVVSKFAVDAAGATWVVGIRFLIAGLLMALLLAKRLSRHLTKDLVRAGCIIGLFSFLVYWTQFLGLEGTTPAKNAFLSACYCLTVPFIWWLVAKRRPTARNLGAAAVCVAGMALVTLQGELSVSWGDGVSMLSALLYGAEIVAIALCVRDHDVITITVVQMVSSGLIAGVAGLVLGLPFDARVFAEPSFLLQMGYIIVLGSCYASTAQNLVQTKVPPAEVSMLFALESVFGTVFSVVFLHEALSAQLLLGFGLIFAAILVSELGGIKVSKEKAAPRG